MARTTPAHNFRFNHWKAVGAAAVGVLLLGAGGATFAEWSDAESSATGAQVTAGVLDLAAGEGHWTNAAGTDVTTAVADGSCRIVPGDALTYSETLTVDARGDLLAATVSHNLRGLTGDAELLSQLDADTAMSLNGRAMPGHSATVIADDELQMLDVEVSVAFADAAGLMGQGRSVELGGLDITLTQASTTS